MDTMNVGANDAGGHIVGLIHEMFVTDGRDWFESWCSNRAGRGGHDDGRGRARDRDW